MTTFINDRGESTRRIEGRTEIKGSTITLPVDIQGVSVAEGERLPIDRAPYTEYRKERLLSAGETTWFNHEVNGSKLGIAIRWDSVTDFDIQVAYVVPGTESTILVPYTTVIDEIATDNAGVTIDVISKFARLRVTNKGLAAATINTVTVVDL